MVSTKYLHLLTGKKSLRNLVRNLAYLILRLYWPSEVRRFHLPRSGSSFSEVMMLILMSYVYGAAQSSCLHQKRSTHPQWRHSEIRTTDGNEAEPALDIHTESVGKPLTPSYCSRLIIYPFPNMAYELTRFEN